MKTLTSISLALITLISIANSQKPESLYIDGTKENKAFYLHSSEKGRLNKLMGLTITKRNYNVISYNLFMDWYPALMGSTENIPFYGCNKIKLVADTSNLKYISLDAENLIIDTVYVDGEPLSGYPLKVDNGLDLHFLKEYSLGDTINLIIYYKYNGDCQSGYYLYNKGRATEESRGGHRFDTLPERLAYTMSEPEDARRWMPCSDITTDKAVASISVKVPKGFTAVSNGLLKNRIDDDTSSTFTWGDTTQIATYLMQATASKFTEIDTIYTKRSGQVIPLTNYTWLKDSSGLYNIYNAHYAYRRLGIMLDLLADWYGDYKYCKYGMVPVQPFGYGGMEHQTLTTINRDWLIGSTSNEADIVHELGHQWLGDYITCSSWSDIWINEGGASYSEAIWWEYLYPNYGEMAEMSNKRWYYFYYGGVTLPPIGAPTSLSDDVLFNYGTTYCKSAWVYYMLKEMVGKDTFKLCLQNAFSKYGFKALSTDEYFDSFKEIVHNCIIPLDTFKTQWIREAGHPVYSIVSPSCVSNGDGTYKMSFKINQTQSAANVPSVFYVNLPIQLQNSSSKKSIKQYFLNNERSQTFSATLDFIPDSIFIDPDVELLCETDQAKVTAVEESISDSWNASEPMPSVLNGGENSRIEIKTDKPEIVKIDVLNELGMPVEAECEKLIEDRDDFIFKSSNLPSGSYFIQIKGESFSAIRKVAVIK